MGRDKDAYKNMKYSFIDILAGILSAIIASMGLGGGGVYIMYLTLVKNTPQINAQGLNLLFFIPCAAVSLIIYIKNKMIKPKAAIPMALGGGVGAVIGNFLLPGIPQSTLKIIFSVFLIIMGVYTVFSKTEKAK